jgi:hypothetical protein
MGKVEDKILKNKVKAELIYRDIAHTPSRGIIARDGARGTGREPSAPRWSSAWAAPTQKRGPR